MIVVDSQFEAERIIQERLKLKGDESNKQKKGIGLGIKIEKDTKKERFLLMRKGDSALLEKKISENKYKSELSQEEIQMIYLKFKDIPQTVIIRADTEGVLETIIDELNRVLGEELVKKFIISKKVGLITEDDFLVFYICLIISLQNKPIQLFSASISNAQISLKSFHTPPK